MESAGKADSNSFVIGTILGHYKILKLLGRGGMGEVYLAEDLRLKREVALKVLPANLNQDKNSSSRFRREATSAAALHHSNICTIHEIGEIDGHTFIAMEYVEGINLHQHLLRESMSINEILDIAIQIADGLDEARKKNIVHRDIKSSNIMLTPRKEVKILDFGLAKQLHQTDGGMSEAATESQLTKDGTIIGTLAYMSPEQALGKTVDHRSDIFSFGIVLYEMLTGRLPFAGNSSSQLLDSIVHQDHLSVTRFNEHVPDSLGRVVNKMLKKDPEDRYQSVHEVWSDLRAIKGEKIETPKDAGMAASKIHWAAILLAVVVLGAVAGAYLLRQSQPADTALTNITSLVALPCKVYGAQEMNYLTDAVPSTLSTILGQIDGLETKVPPTSFEVEQLKGDLGKLASLYKVNSFVISSITAEPSQFTLNVQLVDAQTRRLLWSHQYQGQQKNYNEISQQAAEGIRLALKPNTVAVSSFGLASNSEAELAFHQGKYFSNRYNNLHDQKDFDLAFQHFQRALELDPKLADAAGEIAWLYVFKGEAGESPEIIKPEMSKWAHRAFEINPRSGMAWSALGFSAPWETHANYSLILEYGLKAVAYEPNKRVSHMALSNGTGFASFFLTIPSVLEAHRLDPLYLYAPLTIGFNEYLLGNSNEGLSWMNQALAIEEQAPIPLYLKAVILADLNRLPESQKLSEQLKSSSGFDHLPGYFRPQLELISALTHHKDQLADSLLPEILKVSADPKTSSFDQSILFTINVPFLIEHHRIQPALEILENSTRANVVTYDVLILNPRFQSLQKEDRFQKVLQTSRNQFEEILQQLEEARSRGEFPAYLEKPLKELKTKLDYTKKSL